MEEVHVFIVLDIPNKFTEILAPLLKRLKWVSLQYN